jgi:dienelactone hydrolase
MSDVLLFHHALGRTSGILALAEVIRQAGHQVHVPDLYAGRVFKTLDEGVHRAQSIGFSVLLQEAKVFAEQLPTRIVYAGISLGVMPAQMLAQTRPGAAGALFLEACLPVTEFGKDWPSEIPVQIHGMDHDPIFVGEGDLGNARALVAAAPEAELFLYAGDEHLFVDKSLPSYDTQATRVLSGRLLSFLDRVHQLPV